jgi:hypothetical protein
MKKLLACTIVMFGVGWSQTLLADDFSEFASLMTYFYLSPSQESFNLLQIKGDLLSRRLKSTEGDSAAELVAVEIAKISQSHGWPIIESAYSSQAHEIIAGQTEYARFVADDNQVDITKLDIWWTDFFATGEDQYLEKIFRYAGENLPRHDMNRMFLISAAKWSFRSNCQQHQKVLEFARRRLVLPATSVAQKAYIRECIAAAEGSASNGLAAARQNLAQ